MLCYLCKNLILDLRNELELKANGEKKESALALGFAYGM